MNIRPKILIAFGVPTAVMLISGVITAQALTHSLDTTARVRHTDQVIAAANALIKAAIDTETGERGFVITQTDSFLAPYTDGNITFQSTASQLKVLVSDDPAQLERVDRIVALHQQWIDEAAVPEIAAARAGGLAATTRLIAGGNGKSLMDQLRSVTADLIQREQQLLLVRTAASDSASRSARTVVYIGFGLVVLLELVIALALSKRLADSAQVVTAAARALESGDTTTRADVRSSDEIGELATAFNTMAERLVEAAQTERDLSKALQGAVRDYSAFAARVAEGDLTATVSADGSDALRGLSNNLNSMVEGLADISGRVSEGVQGIRSATSEILAAVSQHTASASEQSAAINETSSTVDQVRAASEQTANKARDVAQRAQRSVQVSDEGTKAVETMVRAMNVVRDRVEAIARDILTLSEQTQQIGEVTATVSDLADQSNILALNASIEAAKAGEHGRGFAVVATEVRNLAEQSKGSTEQVRRILNDIQKATTAAVLATEQGTKVVEEGLELSGRANDGIRSLAETILEAAQAAQHIAASAHQQSVGMDQIAHAMTDMSDSTGQFVAGAQQSQRAAEDLNELAGRLAGLTGRYRV